MEEAKSVDTYIGKKRVNSFQLNEEHNTVNVLFDDNSIMDLSVRQWNYMKSDEAYDDGMVKVRKWIPLTEAILQEMLNDDMPIQEFEYVIQRTGASLDENFDKAVLKMFDPSGTIKRKNDIGLKLINSILVMDKETNIEAITE